MDQEQTEMQTQSSLAEFVSPEYIPEPSEFDSLEYDEQLQEDFLREHEIAVRRSEYLPADSLRNLFLRPTAPVTCYIPKLVFAGAITILAGDPKAGKTTFLLHALGALTAGKTFLNNQLQPTTILYASEQSEVSFRKQAEKIPILRESDRFRVLLYEDNLINKPISVQKDQVWTIQDNLVPPATWDEQVSFWETVIQKNNASVFVIDTLTAFSNFKAGEAFDPGVVHARIQTLKSLLKKRPNLAIVILHHMRKEKSGNKEARAFSDIANSYALRAGTDQNVLIFSPDKKRFPTVRSLIIEGRFVDSEETMEVELTPDGFQLHKKDCPQGKLKEMVKENPELLGLSVRDLAKKTGLSTRQVHNFRQSVSPPETKPGLS